MQTLAAAGHPGKQAMHKNIVRKSAFTLIELLVVISIIALLIAILLPSLSKAKELANRAVCSANERSILQSMIIYAQSDNNYFPSVTGPSATTYQNDPGNPLSGSSATAGTVVYGIYNTPVQQGSPMACMWLMVLQGFITPKSFICPSDPFAINPSNEFSASQTYYSNFGMVAGAATPSTSGNGESYSIAYPWNNLNDVTVLGAWWNDTYASSDLPLVCDMAPAQDSSTNGLLRRDVTQPLVNADTPWIYSTGNHSGDGENVCFGDAHVKWCTNPYVGESHDNIFTFASTGGTAGGGSTLATGTAATGPANLPQTAPFDVVMAPVRDAATGAW